MTITFRIRDFDEVSSTNDEVKRALEAGEDEGLVVRARVQTKGYGRQRRTWASPVGGLYLSVLLRPRVALDVLSTLSLVVGVAVRRALAGFILSESSYAHKTRCVPKDVSYTCEACCAERARFETCGVVQLKWPNDIVVHPLAFKLKESANLADAGLNPFAFPLAPSFTEAIDEAFGSSCSPLSETSYNDVFSQQFSKLCGISLETHAGGVCVGVGVNVLAPDGCIDVGGKNAPAYLVDLAPHLADCAVDEAIAQTSAAILETFAVVYSTWVREGFASFVGEYNSHAALTGRVVRVVDWTGGSLAVGEVLCTDEQGRLVLLSSDGLEIPVTSGEAHIV